MELELVRIAYLPDVTLGRLSAGSLKLATLEEPWIANPKGPGGQRRGPGAAESCVPDGEYQLAPHSGTLFKNVWRLCNPALGVFDFEHELPDKRNWGRATVLIHNGNTTRDILGCILVGTTHGRLDDRPAVLYSVRALNQLREVLGAEESHTLTVRPTLGTGEVAA